ncbi:ATP-dependent DNA helicase [Pseudobacteroides cellulosolvens]|uniref:Helicase c2 n=1 Tax=Pseudobacteroides cellulosolvens ATCC 35603 = DSM 2933 TaxID=398512 RepID=A0A0L6JQZ2_9FIRM|nr:ATP-dependent DNA helicase [Pseudobacteroides cellulosolvens]KNY27797.1 helicase c2 [Pseudobacteroides cellulosolvens ATCC 35603 = DSM 2933]
MASNEIRISIRNLVEFTLRSGDIDNRFIGVSRALEGTKIHQKIQKSGIEGYNAEVPLVYRLEYKGFLLICEGRIDGVIKEDSRVTIDEIKTTAKPLEYIDEFNILHWAQAKCYAYIYAVQNALVNIDVQLTYYQIETEEIKHIRKTFTITEISDFFFELIDKYLKWAALTRNWEIQRNDSIKSLKFPFEKYRSGQRELAIAVYKTISEGRKLFVHAPTGIGKTISTLFPAVKAIGEEKTSKIFYLTAKTITRQVAEESFEIMREYGLKFKTITLTAKEKVCFKENAWCNPENCEYAKGHYDRVDNAIIDIYTSEHSFVRDVVEKYAKKHKICPFEFSLDLAMWADSVICDYNYAFDPRVYLKRFFQFNTGEYTFLIDEAHNLVDRSREMFSAELYKRPFLNLKKTFKTKKPTLSKALSKVNSMFIEMRKECGKENHLVCQKGLKELYQALKELVKESETWLTQNGMSEGYDEMLELYFEVLAFIKIAELYDERYITYLEKDQSDVKFKIFCLDPSHLLGEAIKRGKSAIFFSATLTPIDYFVDILGGNESDYRILLNSAFERDNLCLLISHTISTKFKDRQNSYAHIAQYIYAVISQNPGNYLVFFPSYKYMNEVHLIFNQMYPEVKSLLQTGIMSEEEREHFLDSFKDDVRELLVGFAVLGGIFSEGVDLMGDKLLGAIIVGVGLPQLCLERNIVMDYFNRKNGLGYEYAYVYPGMNKVLQAAGRVIRSEEDRGVVLLIDQRFSNNLYKKLFPAHWNHYKTVNNIKGINGILNNFWGRL